MSKTLKLRVINNEIMFCDLVNNRVEHLNKIIEIYMWDNVAKELKLAIRNEEAKEIIATEKISLALGTDVFLDKLEGYGFCVAFVEEFSYSIETVKKANGLIQAGFSKLIRLDNNYMVDNIFQQNILLETELKDLLENNISELNLSEIK